MAGKNLPEPVVPKTPGKDFEQLKRVIPPAPGTDTTAAPAIDVNAALYPMKERGRHRHEGGAGLLAPRARMHECDTLNFRRMF